MTRRVELFKIHPENATPFTLTVSGREAWALNELIEAGSRGCTPRMNPAPRWSEYIHRLRKRGVPIETIRERHGGEFPGNHGRYVLKARAQLIAVEAA